MLGKLKIKNLIYPIESVEVKPEKNMFDLYFRYPENEPDLEDVFSLTCPAIYSNEEYEIVAGKVIGNLSFYALEHGDVESHDLRLENGKIVGQGIALVCGERLSFEILEPIQI